MKHEVMSPQKANEIMNAFARYKFLTDNKSALVTPDNSRNEAEITGLKGFLSNAFIEYGGELMGCWLAVRQEYEPLVQVVSSILHRADGIRAENAAVAATAALAQKAKQSI
jgi:hypothetical protein